MKKIVLVFLLLLNILELNAATKGTSKSQMYNEINKIVNSIYPKSKKIKWQCKKFNQLDLGGVTTIYYGCTAKTEYKRTIGMQCEEKYFNRNGSMTECKFTKYIH